MHRMQVGSLSYVGKQVRARISITSGQLFCNANLLGRENARDAKRIKETIAALYEKAQKSYIQGQPAKDQVLCLRS